MIDYRIIDNKEFEDRLSIIIERFPQIESTTLSLVIQEYKKSLKGVYLKK